MAPFSPMQRFRAMFDGYGDYRSSSGFINPEVLSEKGPNEPDMTGTHREGGANLPPLSGSLNTGLREPSYPSMVVNSNAKFGETAFMPFMGESNTEVEESSSPSFAGHTNPGFGEPSQQPADPRNMQHILRGPSDDPEDLGGNGLISFNNAGISVQEQVGDSGSEVVDSSSSDDNNVPLMKHFHQDNEEIYSRNSPPQGKGSDGADSALGPGDQSKTNIQDEADSDVELIHASPMKFDWKLPDYEALYEVNEGGYPMAKVSLPGIIREQIFLSPEFGLEEFRLIQEIFLPSQKAQPDQVPKLALLNFHTAAVIVLEAFALRDSPGDVDTDEVFFAVLDNWRIGKEAGKKNYGAIRGVQEFFEVAQDVIFHLKEHGFQEKQRVRRERSDKGVKRGPRVFQVKKKEKPRKYGPNAGAEARTAVVKGRVGKPTR
ncbi:uncharacterized protein BDR25DRAFT_316560 [Lindgomyces ingoldianus]|uniref:Uncharacterized protein n=1 Tax=Lindgomyces ingoldianus TaxID=673940 RepID=A0ACB6QLR3_9PLEO|nr:uncharacterized protein BDR25DRAFT_316560 [Lindgomyces ingoldianus]KAF2467954.1 hypothetical protein BDR25DRAFT_316560 [Lindgomyces ingoldianus]